jgi:hypothetical protein
MYITIKDYFNSEKDRTIINELKLEGLVARCPYCGRYPEITIRKDTYKNRLINSAIDLEHFCGHPATSPVLYTGISRRFGARPIGKRALRFIFKNWNELCEQEIRKIQSNVRLI